MWLAFVLVMYAGLFLIPAINKALEITALNSRSMKPFYLFIRYQYRKFALRKAKAVIYDTIGYRDTNRGVFEVVLYELNSRPNLYNNIYMEEGFEELRSEILDVTSRVVQFVGEWTANQYLYPSQLVLVWKAHKDEYLTRGGMPKVPPQLRPDSITSESNES